MKVLTRFYRRARILCDLTMEGTIIQVGDDTSYENKKKEALA